MGPDQVPVIFIKTFSVHLIEALYKIFNKSNNIGIFPKIWGTSFVTPIPKKGDKQNVVNYRSVVKTSIFGKLFDSLIEGQLSKYLRRTIVGEQHGFMPRRSTCSNLATYSTYIVGKLKNKQQVDSVYTDMKSAFDRVDHGILLFKLKNIGVIGTALEWIGSFLKNRRLVVKIKNYKSYEYEATSGVPQGSHCGPLLFLFMINDLFDCVEHSQALMFADDFKLFRTITCQEDQIKLQSDLNNVNEWAKNNGFEFNVGKCAVVSFYGSKFDKYPYFLDRQELVRVDSVKDLGVYFDSTYTFEVHIKYIINKAMKKLGFIQRFSRNFKDSSIFLQLYKTLVKPILTYASEIWSPRTKTLTYEIEKLQHKFLRIYAYRIGTPLPFNQHNYSEILRATKLPTLEDSRGYQDVLFVFKVINQLIDSSDLLDRLNWHVPARILRPTGMVFAKEVDDVYLHRSVLSRAGKIINEKLGDIDLNFASLSEFKKITRQRILFTL